MEVAGLPPLPFLLVVVCMILRWCWLLPTEFILYAAVLLFSVSSYQLWRRGQGPPSTAAAAITTLQDMYTLYRVNLRYVLDRWYYVTSSSAQAKMERSDKGTL